MDRAIADLGPVPVALNAQLRTVGFYAGFGFVPEGEVFDEAGIDHLRMTLAPD
jgi:ElaA protein